MDGHKCTLHNAPTGIYGVFFPLATENTFNLLEICFILYFTNNLLVHTYISTTGYADYHPTGQYRYIKKPTVQYSCVVAKLSLHCADLLDLTKRQNQQKTKYTKNVFLTVQCVTLYVDICGTIGAINNTACKIC